MFDIKEEVEQYTAESIDIEKYLEKVREGTLEKGIKIDDKYIKQI